VVCFEKITLRHVTTYKLPRDPLRVLPPGEFNGMSPELLKV